MEMAQKVEKSPWIVHFNCNSCNGCDIELLACLTPMYDVERFGILHVGNPKHADVLVVTGSVNHRTARVLKNVYDQIPDPKVVVALGVCASTGGIFAEGYNVLGGIDKVIPVDVFVPGCPSKPEAMMDGILKAAGKLYEKRTGKKLEPAPQIKMVRTPKETAPVPAEAGKAVEMKGPAK
jgi:ech hydrogenase subunit C